MLGLILDPIVLCILIWAIARKNAEFDFLTIFPISLGLSGGGWLVNRMLGEGLAPVTLLVVLSALVFLLMRYCYTTIGQAVIVTGLFLGYQVAMSIAFRAIFGV